MDTSLQSEYKPRGRIKSVFHPQPKVKKAKLSHLAMPQDFVWKFLSKIFKFKEIFGLKAFGGGGGVLKDLKLLSTVAMCFNSNAT